MRGKRHGNHLTHQWNMVHAHTDMAEKVLQGKEITEATFLSTAEEVLASAHTQKQKAFKIELGKRTLM